MILKSLVKGLRCHGIMLQTLRVPQPRSLLFFSPLAMFTGEFLEFLGLCAPRRLPR